MTFETIGTDFEGMAGGGTAQGFFTNSPPPQKIAHVGTIVHHLVGN